MAFKKVAFDRPGLFFGRRGVAGGIGQNMQFELVIVRQDPTDIIEGRLRGDIQAHRIFIEGDNWFNDRQRAQLDAAKGEITISVQAFDRLPGWLAAIVMFQISAPGRQTHLHRP